MLQAGQIVRVPPLRDAEAAGANSPANNNKAAQDDAKERLQKLILHEDEALLILNKPYGLSVQGGSKMRHHLGRLLAESGEPYAQAKLIHRLDRDTSGLLVLGKTVAAARHLSKQFQQRRVQKNYLALILGVPHPQEGEITAYVKKAVGETGSQREQLQRAEHGEKGAQFSKTEYEILAQAGRKASLVMLRPLTGRTHQLRAHMAWMGHAIAGDHKYLCDREPLQGEIEDKLHLHAASLHFLHPQTEQPVLFSAPLPDHMRKAFHLLGFSEREISSINFF